MYTGPTLPPKATSHLVPAQLKRPCIAGASLYSWGIPVQLERPVCEAQPRRGRRLYYTYFV